MKIEVDKLDVKSFTKLQTYLDGESNRYMGSDDRPGKVHVSRIDREPVDESGMYEGVQLDVADGELTRTEMGKLMDIVYQNRSDVLDQPLSELGLSIRAIRSLWLYGHITTIGGLCELREIDLVSYEFRNLGRKSIEKIKQKLSEYGLRLREDGDRIEYYRVTDNDDV